MAIRGDIFGSVPVGKIRRSNFNLSHQLTGNFQEGVCYPVFCEDSLPGSSWTINLYNITKLETLLAPAMQRTNANMLWFKIPKRLCMRQFKKWYTGGTDGMSTVEKPYTTLASIASFFISTVDVIGETKAKYFFDLMFGEGSVWQCIGLPIPIDYSGATPQIIYPFKYDSVKGIWVNNWSDEVEAQKIDLIPFTAYALLYDEYFCDQTLSDRIFSDSANEFPTLNAKRLYYPGADQDPIICDGTENVFEGGLKSFEDIWPLFLTFRRAWKKDYYTSALPTPQRGPEVTLDLFEGKNVPVNIPSQNTGLTDVHLISENSHSANTNWSLHANIPESGNIGNIVGTFSAGVDDNFNTITGKNIALNGTADLSGLSPITIVALRNLFKLQSFMEKNNVAGGRFIEYILAHWAERVPDFTVQRPQFVRATQIPVIVSEVTATANTGVHNNQVGDQAGRAKAQGNLGKCRIYTQEPCIILGIYCVTIPPAYASQGIPKKFQRFSRFDEPYVEFQHIGEQAILNKEIFLDWQGKSDVSPEDEFGYQQRYSEFKYLPDRVIGDFSTSLAYWNQARIFTDQPSLNQEFIEQKPSDRIFAVENQKPVIADFWFDIKCSMKLSKFSTPKMS